MAPTDPLSSDQRVRHLMMATILRASIAEQIRAMRLARNLSQADVAKSVGTSQTVISRWEDPHGEWMSVDSLNRIAAFFDVALQINFAAWSEFLELYCKGKLPPPTPYSEGATS